MKKISIKSKNLLLNFKKNINFKENSFIFEKKFNKINLAIFLIVLGLGVFGCIMVYSASSYVAQYRYGNPYFYLTKQIVGVALGAVAMFVFSKINYQKLKKFKWVGIIISIILLALVFIPIIGVENYGARRWINLGFFTIQPSEFAKFAFVLFAAAYLSENYEKVGKFKTLLPVLAVGTLFCVLIILEPNMSITMCMGLIMLFMLFVGGARMKHFMILGVPAAAAVPVLILIEPYRIYRILAFLDPWASPQGEGFQLIQSLYSLGSGGFFGVGLFNSRAKYSFLPFSESDFIFSIIGEELGLVGAICVLVLFAILIIAGLNIAKKARTRFGCYLATGISAIIAIQAILNVMVVTGLVPPTGLPLPFVSAGSTSLVVFLASVGVLLNIHRQNTKNLSYLLCSSSKASN